jgi:hypothetical protein
MPFTVAAGSRVSLVGPNDWVSFAPGSGDANPVDDVCSADAEALFAERTAGFAPDTLSMTPENGDPDTRACDEATGEFPPFAQLGS